MPSGRMSPFMVKDCAMITMALGRAALDFQRLRQGVAEVPLGRDAGVPVTISVGVACFPLAGTDQTTLLRAADMALYQAKALGKNRSIVFRPSEEGKAS